jgi:hypothetical protein
LLDFAMPVALAWAARIVRAGAVMRFVRSMLRLNAVAAALMLASCVTAPVGPDNPGTRVRFKSPDVQKWVMSQTFDRRTIYRCRPLACAEGSVVNMRTMQSPTRSPDPQALEKFAQEDAERTIAQTQQASSATVGALHDITPLTSRVTKVKDYPAVHWEYRAIGPNEKTVYLVRELVFAGNSMIEIVSSSFGLEVARRNGVDFAGIMEIDDFAPPAR